MRYTRCVSNDLIVIEFHAELFRTGFIKEDVLNTFLRYLNFFNEVIIWAIIEQLLIL